MRSWLLLSAVVVMLAGCKEREPVPVHVLVVRAEGAGFVLDGQPMAHDQVISELETLANRSRTSPSGSARMVVSIRQESGVPYDRIVELVDQCGALGINKIEIGSR